MVDYRIVDISSQEDLDSWDDFVEHSPQGSLFHKSYWLKSGDRTFHIYGLYKGQELFAGFPVVVQNIAGVKRATMPPLTPWLGPIYQRNQAKYVTKISNRKKINEKFAQKISSEFDYLSLNFSPSIKDLQPYIWEGFSSNVRYTYRLDLTHLDNIWDSMDASRRRNIRKAKKDGIKILKTDDFDSTFKLVEKTFARQNKSPSFKSWAYTIDKMLRRRKRSQSFIANDSEGKTIATVYIVWDNRIAYYLLGGYDPEDSHHGASAFAMWRAIQYSKKELDLEIFDFEGSMIQQIESFFRKFGGRLTPYYSLTWGNLAGRAVFGGRHLAGKFLRKLNLR